MKALPSRGGPRPGRYKRDPSISRMITLVPGDPRTWYLPMSFVPAYWTGVIGLPFSLR